MEKKYHYWTKQFEESTASDDVTEITTENIIECRQQLYDLNFTGPIIANLITANQKSAANIIANREIRITADNGDYYANFLSKLFTRT